MFYRQNLESQNLFYNWLVRAVFISKCFFVWSKNGNFGDKCSGHKFGQDTEMNIIIGHPFGSWLVSSLLNRPGPHLEMIVIVLVFVLS